MQINCIEESKQIAATILVQPVTVEPNSLETIAHINPIILMTDIIIPIAEIILSGFTERLVMPSIANAIIRLNG